jgi:hypothetical protein
MLALALIIFDILQTEMLKTNAIVPTSRPEELTRK